MSSGAAAEQILACWSRGHTANSTKGGGGGSGGLQGTLGFDPREEEPTVYSQRDLSSRQPGGADDPDFPFLFET